MSQTSNENTLNPQVLADLKIIEDNHLGHFIYLPEKLGFPITESHGVTVINCGLKTSMFNMAYGSPKSLDIKDTIEAIKAQFSGKPFAWWIPATDYHQAITHAMLQSGLNIETIEYAMIAKLENANEVYKQVDLSITRVNHLDLLPDFLSVLAIYDEHVGAFYHKMTAALFDADEQLFVGYMDGKPVTIAILFCQDNSASIFSLITNEDARGKGYGSEMMRYLLKFAKNRGCKTVTLSASSDEGYRIYERFGFKTLGAFECFEYPGNN